MTPPLLKETRIMTPEAQHTPAGNLRVTRWDWERWIRRWPLTDGERLLALTMATYANGQGNRIHPGDDRLARVLRCSDRTVRRNRQKLIDEGLLERTRRAPSRGKADEYALTIPLDAPYRVDALDPEDDDR